MSIIRFGRGNLGPEAEPDDKRLSGTDGQLPGLPPYAGNVRRFVNSAALLASDLAKDLRNSSIKSHLWCQFTAKWHSPSRASHVDFETRYNRTRVMTSRAFAAARFSVGDFLL